MKSKIIFTLIFWTGLVLGQVAYAQPLPPTSNNPAPLGGIILLAAAGAALGAKNIYDSRNKGD